MAAWLRLDYDDQLTQDGTVKRFYLCRAKCGGGGHCGYYYASKLWQKTGKSWYCKADWTRAFKEGDEGWDVMANTFGPDASRWPAVGCGAKFAPWRRGESIVLEWRCSDSGAGEERYEAMLADLMPEMLDQEVGRGQKPFLLRFTLARNRFKSKRQPSRRPSSCSRRVGLAGSHTGSTGWCEPCVSVSSRERSDLAGAVSGLT